MHKNMKKLIIWLAKMFNVSLEKEVIKYVTKEVEKQVTLEGVIEGDVTIKGNLIVNGILEVNGEVACHKIK